MGNTRSLLRNTIIIGAGAGVTNVSNYAFHLLSGRLLGPETYAALASVIAVLYIISVPVSTLQLVATKLAARLDQSAGARRIFLDLTTKALPLGVFFFLALALLSGAVAGFLRLDSRTPLIMLSPVFIFAFLLPINRGIMQGYRSFGQLSINMAVETGLKLGLGVTLIWFGLGLNGAVLAIVVSMATAYLASFLPLRQRLRTACDTPGPTLSFMVSTFMAVLSATALYNIDLILAKHYLSAFDSGQYAGLALLGKIVLFAGLPIASAMFPVTAALSREGKDHRGYFLRSSTLSLMVSLGVVGVFVRFPQQVVSLLLGPKYLAVVAYIPVFGLAMVLLVLANAFIHYYLSIGFVGFIPWLAGTTILQGLLIAVFHESVSQIVMVMLATMGLLFIMMTALLVAIGLKSSAGVNPEVEGADA